MSIENRVGFVGGVAEALGIVALFVAGGLLWAGQLAAEPGAPRVSPPSLYALVMEDEVPAPSLWLVDGYNVLSVGLLAGEPREGWWRRRGELLQRVEHFDEAGAEVWVAFDGAQEADPGAGRVRVVFAPDADTWLLDRLSEIGPERVALVTADRSLADRARHRGAQVVSPARFLERCPT